MDVLNCDMLDDQCLPVVYGLTTIRSKERGNKLLVRFAKIFKESYEIRTGKTPPLVQERATDIDFADFDDEELDEALAHFVALARSFEETGHKSSTEFCQTIVSLIYNRQYETGVGHA